MPTSSFLHPPPPQSFEQLNQRAVAVVIDPIQSVKGKVVIDAFRTINPQLMLLNQEPRQTTSNIGHLNKPSIQALIHGLNRHYYSIVIDYRKNELEEQVRAANQVEKGACGIHWHHLLTYTPLPLLTLIDVDELAQEELDLRPEAAALRRPPQGQREDHRGKLLLFFWGRG